MKTISLPTLSVVVPVYNEEAQLKKCLQSLAMQLDDIDEILIVDNNSTDTSPQIARVFLKQAGAKCRLLSQPKQGLVPTRNLGFTEAKSDIVARIDADTQVRSGWALAIKTKFANKPRVSAIYGDTRYHDIPFERFTTTVSAFFVDISNRFSSGSPSLYGPNMALRTHVAQQIATEACDKPRLMEDLDITIHLRRLHRRIAFCKDMSVYISGRRLASIPYHYWSYCIMWPRTYAIHGMYLAAFTSSLVALIGCIAQLTIFIPLRSYNPETRRFSFRHLWLAKQDRIIP